VLYLLSYVGKFPKLSHIYNEPRLYYISVNVFKTLLPAWWRG
jgi:hypothetical protein